MRALLAIRNLPQNDNIMERRYYLPASYNGVDVGGMHHDPKRARREVFAELWASINSKSTKRLPEIYPRTYAFVQSVNTVLVDLHDQAPMRCTYTLDGKAIEQKIKTAKK
jgi:hypothetical protein